MMESLSNVQVLIMSLASHGVCVRALQAEVAQRLPEMTDEQFQTALFALQERNHIIGQEVNDQWVVSTVDHAAPAYQSEYSPEFAEMIIAASCGEMTEIDPDEMIVQLEVMIKNARLKKSQS